VISLKRYLESDSDELSSCALESYRSSLIAMGNAGAQVCPHISYDFRKSLLELQERVSEPTPLIFKETQEQLEEELRKWSESATEYFKSKACEFRDLMLVLARTADGVGERSQNYNRQFSDVQTRLERIADLEDVTKIRSSLLQSALDLKGCVDKMAQESQASVAQMQEELTKSQERLRESERLASIDALTGLCNRRTVELELDTRIARKSKVCIMIIDINGFKQINDRLGHLSGDRILTQFATELRAAIRVTDVVGRWAGDEFLAIFDCDLTQAQAQLKRIREWVFGSYSLVMSNGTLKLNVTAAVGLAQHKPRETALQLLERADAAMYRDKLRPPAHS
jgi:diguanylate cyclase (GGDEF)-like protein